jgi:two-component system, chemotaxis family, chemotaxis protein CheY
MEKKRILIADDSATARMFLQRCLEIAGCRDAEFIEAANGAEALELLGGDGTVDLVVTDLTMPEMDGMELLDRIQASPKLHGIPVIVVTSAKNPARREKLESMGVAAVLGKPISPATVADTLADIFGGEE